MNPINSQLIVHEVDLKYKKLSEEIHHLEKKLKKQNQLGLKAHHNKLAPSPHTNRAALSPNSIQIDSHSAQKTRTAHSPRSQVSVTTKRNKQTKPAISQNWKHLFKKDPIFIDPFAQDEQNSKEEQSFLWREPSLPEPNNRMSNLIMSIQTAHYCQ